MRIVNSLIKSSVEHPNNLFNYLFWNLFFVTLPICVIAGVLSLFEKIPVIINDKPKFGVLGLLFMIIYAFIFPLLFTIILYAYLKLGNFILRFFFK